MATARHLTRTHAGSWHCAQRRAILPLPRLDFLFQRIRMTKRRCFWMLAALSLACGRSSSHAPGVPTAERDSTTRHDSIGGRGVARALAFGTGVQSGVQSGIQEAPPAEPTASYASVKAACDSAQVWLRRTLDTTVVRHDGSFTNEFVEGSAARMRARCGGPAEQRTESRSG